MTKKKKAKVWGVFANDDFTFATTRKKDAEKAVANANLYSPRRWTVHEVTVRKVNS